MKQLLRIIVSAVLIVCISSAALAAEDIRLSLLRDGDDLIPTPESIFYTRYTPWIKSMHLVTAVQSTAGIMGGEGCQQIRCFNISPVDNNLVVFGSDTSGVWITKNGGEHWYNTNRNIHHTDIADVLCHPTDTNILFAYSIGSGTGDFASPGIYRSTDCGRSWTRTLTDYISASKCDRLFAYDSEGSIYAVTGKGIVKSTDDGATWSVIKACEETVNDPDNTAPAVSINISTDGNTIVACYSGNTHSLAGINIGQYIDGQWQWTKKYINAQDSVTSVYALAVQSYSPLRMIASYAYSYLDTSDNTTKTKYGLGVTADGGDSWTAFKDSVGDSYERIYTGDPILKIQIFGEYLYVTYDTTNRAFRYLPVSEIENAATTREWTAVNLKDEYTDEPAAITSTSNMFISAGFDVCDEYILVCAGGINKYDFDTKKWSRRTGGYSGLSVTHFNMDSDGNMILSRVDGNIVVSDSPYTSSNTPTFTGMPGAGRTHATMTVKDPFDAEGDRYICWNGNSNSTKSKVGIIVTEDGGNTYVDKDQNPLELTEDNNKYYPNRISDPLGINTHVLEYVTVPNDKTYIYSSCAASGDNGSTWELNDYFILDICDTEPNKMMAWDIYGDAPTYYIMYSEDYGKTWDSIYHSTMTDSLGDETKGFFDISDSNRFYLTANWGMGVIDISKKTFGAKSHGFHCGNAVLRQNPKYPNHLLLGMKNYHTEETPTLLESLDGGNSWHIVPGIFGARDIKEIQFSTTTNEAFLGCHNGTIVYEYDNFWHYTTAKLTYDGEEKQTVFDVSKDEDGKCYIIAPSQVFFKQGEIFVGWQYGEELYREGERIYIEK